MTKLLTLAAAAGMIASLCPAQTAASIQVININAQLVSALKNFAGFNASNPYVEVLISNPSAQADGYRIHLTYTDSQGVVHDVLRDAGSPATGNPIMEVFWVDAAQASATATPYKLQSGSIGSQ